MGKPQATVREGVRPKPFGWLRMSGPDAKGNRQGPRRRPFDRCGAGSTSAVSTRSRGAACQVGLGGPGG